jgi:CTP:molybdopterin cytidylyltransferase MocA
LQKGLAATSANCWVMLHLIDHPFIQPETYELLIDAINIKYLVIKPVLSQKKESGHPILISPVFRAMLLNASPESHLKDIIYYLPQKKIKLISVNDMGIIDNLNTPEEFQKKLRSLNGNCCK